MITGKGTLSYRAKSLENQKIPAVGFVKTVFAHKASAGDTGFAITALTVPTEMTANGFQNPPASQLTAAQILYYRNNLRLVSSARGVLVDNLSYRVSSNTQISFIDFTALEGEIFVGTLDYAAHTGLKVVDATGTPATGVLAAGTTDFNIGNPLQTNKYPTTQMGAVMVFKDGVIQTRNTSNSSTVLDGNYYEVDNGGGSFTLIRFNIADITDTNIVVIPNGLLSERPDGSMMAVIETVQGQVNNMATYVAALAGQTETTILGGAPSNADLQAFGSRMISLENNRARIDVGNTWTANQKLIGRTDGTSPASGEIGEIQTFTHTGGTKTTTVAGTPVDVHSFSIPAGVWFIMGCYYTELSLTSTVAGASHYASVLFTDNSNTVLTAGTAAGLSNWIAGTTSASLISSSSFMYTLSLTTPTTYKVRVVSSQSTAGGSAAVVNDGSSFVSGSIRTAAWTKAMRIG